MGKFRKKPVVIEAYCYNQVRDNYRPDWLSDAMSANRVITFPTYALIRTLEGEMRCDLGDWIIKGVKGELYPCKPDIFAMTYEPGATPTPDVMLVPQAAIKAADELVAACEKEFTSALTESGPARCYDKEPVADPTSCITFGHIRRARKALAAMLLASPSSGSARG